MAFEYPSIPTEFEIQATLYLELRRLGYNVRVPFVLAAITALCGGGEA